MQINVSPRETVEVYCGGTLVAEVAAGAVDTQKDFRRELTEARASRNAMRFLKRFTEIMAEMGEKAEPNLVHGFIDGLNGKTEPYPSDSKETQQLMTPIEPVGDPAYNRGYAQGKAIRRAQSFTQPAARKHADKESK